MSAWKRLIALALLCLLPMAAALAEDEAEDPADEVPEQEEDDPRVGIVSYGPANLDDEMEARFPDEAHWLENETERFLVLQRRHQTAARRGGAVLIADAGRSPAAGLASGIRDSLAREGWHSIALSLPETPLEPLPERALPEADEPLDNDEDLGDEAEPNGDEAEPNGDESELNDEADVTMTIEVLRGEGDGQAFLEDYLQAGFDRVDAAVAELRNQGIESIVLIGVGQGADVATRYMLANQPAFMPGGLGLIWVNGRFTEPMDGDLEEVLGQGFGIPLLDLYDRRRHGEQATKRRGAAERGAFENYRQVPMPLPRETGTAVQRRVGARITGWLENNMVAPQM